VGDQISFTKIWRAFGLKMLFLVDLYDVTTSHLQPVADKQSSYDVHSRDSAAFQPASPPNPMTLPGKKTYITTSQIKHDIV